MKVRRMAKFMYIKNIDDAWGWKPFNIVFAVESEAEARALYAIFNYGPNVDILPEDVDEEIRKAIGGKHGNISFNELIARGVSYEEFYRGKKGD